MYNIEEFIDYFMEFYFDTDITNQEARKYTKLYIELFPNLWDGDSLDREKIYSLIMMGRGDALAKQRKLEYKSKEVA
tara:strand:+ start:296 stop:526 length:231 start_codon:yes stop_codon:yes gene_type:complete